jgi:hypothetical protein
MRWFKPGVDFSKYHRLILEPVVFFFAPDSEYKGMDPRELKKLADAFKLELVETLKKRYPIVKTPGPDVGRIRFAITDLRQNRPVLGNIPPEGAITHCNVDLKKQTYTSWSGSGVTAAELIVFDSMTQEVVAAAKDDKAIGLKEKFTRWGSAEDAFKYWADRLRAFLDLARSQKG